MASGIPRRGRLTRFGRVGRTLERQPAPRWFFAGLILGLVSSTVLAASLGVAGTRSLGAGSIALTQCDSSVTVTVGAAYNTSATSFTVGAITLSDISVSCAAKTLSLVGYSGTATALTFTTVLPSSASWSSTITVTPATGINLSAVQGTALEIKD